MSARPHFSLVGIPVRVEPVFFVISGLFGLQFLDGYFIVGNTIQRGGLDVVGLWMFATFVSILVHELGHGFTLKAFGQRSAIVLHGFGGVTVSTHRSQLSRSRSILVSLAGSLTALIVLWLPTRQVLGSGSLLSQPAALIWLVYFLSFQNLWWSVINLLPIRPLDGGNGAAQLFGIHAARRISIGAALAGAVVAFVLGQGYAAFFAVFLAFNNWQEIRAERAGANVNVFEVESPDPGGRAAPRGRPRGRRTLHAVPSAAAGAPTMGSLDPARAEQLAWAALRAGDAPAAQRLVAGMGSAAGAYLRASAALTAGDPAAFALFEAAFVAEPNGPPNLVATEVLARSGAAAAVAKRLVERADGKGRGGAAALQTHLHYADRFREAAEVGETVYAAGPASRAQTAFEVACSWAREGDVDRSMTWLDHAADAGFRAPSIVDGEPDLATVRADPRWPVMRARLA